MEKRPNQGRSVRDRTELGAGGARLAQLGKQHMLRQPQWPCGLYWMTRHARPTRVR